MLRREIRMRKEYLYRKAQEEQERTVLARKKIIRQALDENKPVPTDLRGDAVELQRLMEYEDSAVNSTSTHEDDEYRWAGVEDPKVILTTSRDPSSKLKEFVKEMRLVFPNSQRMNRGAFEMTELVAACRANQVTDLILLRETRGIPDGMDICHLPYGPTARFTLFNVVTRHDIATSQEGDQEGGGTRLEKVSEVFPHLIFHNFTTPLGERAMNILKYLFPVPKQDSKRVMTFANTQDFISFRHHVYKKLDHRNIDLKEIGPRFEMQMYEIKLGTIDKKKIAETEWHLHPYLRTAKKRQLLGASQTEPS